MKLGLVGFPILMAGVVLSQAIDNFMLMIGVKNLDFKKVDNPLCEIMDAGPGKPE